MHHSRLAQVSAFTIIAIVVIAAAVLITTLSRSGPNEEIPQALALPPKAQAVYDLMNACVQSATERALLAIGSGGGYHIVPSHSLTTELGIYPFYTTNRQVTAPTTAQVEQSLATYITAESERCREDVELQGTTITPLSAPQARVRLQSGSLTTTLNAPLRLAFGTGTYDLASPYTITLQTQFFLLHETAVKIAQASVADPLNLNLDVLLEGALQSEVTPYGNAFIYMLSEPTTKVGNLPILFIFAVEGIA